MVNNTGRERPMLQLARLVQYAGKIEDQRLQIEYNTDNPMLITVRAFINSQRYGHAKGYDANIINDWIRHGGFNLLGVNVPFIESQRLESLAVYRS